jgi:ABC-type phosphate/phosphonate transport system substrate-binding protein
LEQGFQLLARPIEQADEVSILARADDPRMALQDFKGGKIVSELGESFVYLLGRFLLDENGTASDRFEYGFTGHEIKAARALLAGEADLMFMQTESFRSLSGLTRGRLRELTASDAGLAFHLFCLNPACAELRPALEAMLANMAQDPKGARVLEDLGVAGWSAPAPEELAMLSLLYRRYCNG